MFELLLGAVLQVVINQRSGRRILTSQNLTVTLNSGNQVQRQLLTELNTPLVEGIDAPHNTLNEGDVLVQGNQGAQNARGQARRHDGGGGAVTAEDTCVDHVLCGALCTNLFLGLAESKSLGLCEEVSQEQLVNVLLAVLGRVDRVSECQEVRGDQAGTLVNQLVESVLAVGAGSPQNTSPVA